MKLVAILLLFAIAPAAPARDGRAPRVEILTVHSAGLEGNAFGDPADQQVAVYLPPGYDKTSRRYPVLYLLHGIGDDYHAWTEFFEVPATLDRLIAGGSLPPVIAVMPSSSSRVLGTYYVNSPVNGHWEDYVVDDVVTRIDKTFRTLAKRESRALLGHSMGGFGAISIGMHRAKVFSVIYAMSPCCLELIEDVGYGNFAAYRDLLAFKSYEDADAALKQGNFYPVALLAILSALAPHPGAPLNIDIPVKADRNQLVPAHPAYERFRDAFPVRTAPLYADNLRTLTLLQIEYGLDDQFAHIPVATEHFAQVLNDSRVPHVIDVYDGDHRNQVKQRLGTRIFPTVVGRLVQQ